MDEAVEYRGGGGAGGADPEAPEVLVRARPHTAVVTKETGMFDRFKNSVWNPTLDSSVLETEHQKLAYPQTRRRFCFGLIYIAFSALAWCIYFGVRHHEHWIPFVTGCGVLLVCDLLILAFTFTTWYKRYVYQASFIISLFLCLLCLLSFVYDDPAMSRVGLFTCSMEILLLMYTVIPLRLYVCFTMGILYTVLFETLSALLVDRSMWGSGKDFIMYTLGRILLHLCIHLLGVHFFFMSQLRERKTFLKVGQSIVLRRDLEIEKDLKKKMINSLMPEQVAREVIQSREEGAKKEEESAVKSSPRHRNSKPTNMALKGKMTFRTFHMSQMEHTSILFADIVGFTKMSSNKTAEHLVTLLNDLFGRFDVICDKSGCEKISTLGDCYYCVSGCPQPRPDHAECCVEMGLGMVVAIEEFDRDHNEAVGMRVGVHTGTVLCGLVGTRRFKFDVWSHDVTIANLMESEGKPGLVHISEPTYELVKQKYEVEVGEEIADIRKHKTLIEYYNMQTQTYDIKHVQDEAAIKTWFIKGRRAGTPPAVTNSIAGPDDVSVTVDKVKPDVKVENGESCINNDKATASQGESNATVTLLGKRSASLDDIQEDGDTFLLQQITRAGGREEQDKEIVYCMRKDSQVEEYLHRPPINKCTLNFLKPGVEDDYRRRYLHARGDTGDGGDGMSLPRWSACRDMVVSFIFFILISVCCFLNFTIRPPWVVFFALATVLQVIMILPHIFDVYFHGFTPDWVKKTGDFFLGWYQRHLFGAIIASVPIAAVYCNFSCAMFGSVLKSDLFYALILTATLVHYCNFTILSSWLKSSLATVGGLVLLVLIAVGVCSHVSSPPDVQQDDAAAVSPDVNATSPLTTPTVDVVYNATTESADGTGQVLLEIFKGNHPLQYEIFLNILLLLLLIWFLNRDFEVSCRLSYHGDVQAMRDRQQMQDEKEQADWLLHNIIPEHVTNVLKKTSKYCKNHTDVGVVFAKITNYDDFYDESYEGGKEYLRVLNELMGDFEELFDDPKYKDVEKIKTIGSCLMVASGLNPETREKNIDPNAHLYALIEFSQELLRKLEDFNAEIFNFSFEMAIGFNYGPVTAGVIGTTKLLYDIWGDTVNVSSRMYSTGVSGKIQVTGDCARKLEAKFNFEYRGQTFVKGKGDLDTYLLVGKKEGASWQ